MIHVLLFFQMRMINNISRKICISISKQFEGVERNIHKLVKQSRRKWRDGKDKREEAGLLLEEECERKVSKITDITTAIVPTFPASEINFFS